MFYRIGWDEVAVILWAGAHFVQLLSWALCGAAWALATMAWWCWRVCLANARTSGVKLREVEAMAAWMLPGGTPPREPQNEKSPRRRWRFRAQHQCPPQAMITVKDLHGRPLLGPVSGEQLAYLARYGSAGELLLAGAVMTIEPVADRDCWKAPA